MVTTIRRYVETDTGHRVPNHKSKCRHMHGHRYRFEAEIEGDVVDVSGVSEEGMLMDFSDISDFSKITIFMYFGRLFRIHATATIFET